MNPLVLIALITALKQEVVLLETELAQQQAQVQLVAPSITNTSIDNNVVATTTPVVYQIYTAPVINPVQNQPVLGDASPTCTITATTVGDSSTPQTYIQWTLSGLPTSTIGNVMGVEYTNGGLNDATSSYQHLMNLQNVGSGPYPNQNTALAGRWFQSMTADFGGATCSVIPEPQPY